MFLPRALQDPLSEPLSCLAGIAIEMLVAGAFPETWSVLHGLIKCFFTSSHMLCRATC